MSEAASAVYKLAYVSQADEKISYGDIQNILKSSVARNQTNKITGLLIYGNGSFTQLLESPTNVILKETLARIVSDKRHHSVRVIGEWSSTSRIFSEWSMGFFDSDIEIEHPQKSIIEKINCASRIISLPKTQDLISYFNYFVQAGIVLR